MAGSPGRSGRPDPDTAAARISRTAAVIGAVTAVITLAGAIVGIIYATRTSPAAAPPGVIAVAGAPTSTTVPCNKKLTITTPKPGQHETGRPGARVTGVACGLNFQYGWLFDSDGQDPYYYEVFADSPGPVVQGNGKWSTIDQPIGGPGDVDKTYYLTLVLASASCDNALRQLQPTDGDYKLLGFPSGCQIVAKVPVTVTY